MNRNLKSLAYSFIANDINVYFPDGEDNCFLVEKLECFDCGTYWHTSLLECFFCGELNYYLYTDTNTGKLFSITNSNGGDHKIKACVNPNCLSNTNEEIKKIVNKSGGVFELNSSFNLSQNYCIKCGSAKNKYNSIKVFLFDDTYFKSFDEFLKSAGVSNGDCIVIKKHVNEKIVYNYLFYEKSKVRVPDCNIDNIHKLIESIFKENSNI